MMYSSLMSSGCRTWLRGRRWSTARTGRCLRRLRLRHLQRADVSDNGPAILHRNLRGVRRHRAPTVGDRVEEMADGRLTQTIFVEVRRATKTAAHDHAVAVSSQTMTDAAKDIVAFAPALHCLFGNRKRESIRVIGVDVCRSSRGSWSGRRLRGLGCVCDGVFFTGEQCFVCAQIAARYRSRDGLPHRETVAKERRAAI